MADISKITVPNGSAYNLKDNSAIASIAKTSTGISYTTRSGDKTSLDGIGSNIITILSLDDSSLGIMTSGNIEVINTSDILFITLLIDNVIAYSAEDTSLKIIMGKLNTKIDSSDQTALILTI